MALISFSSRRSIVLLAASLLLCAVGAVASYIQAVRRLERIELDRVGRRIVVEAEAFQQLAAEATEQVRAIAWSESVRRLAERDSGAERRRLERDLIGRLRANPRLQQLRLIRADAEGREWVRVDRGALTDPPRVVREGALQAKGARPYVQAARALAQDAVYVSPIELNREAGDWERPFRPVLRAATPVRDEAGRVVAIVVANLDLSRDLAGLARVGDDSLPTYVVDREGQFLLHPDPAKRFGVAQGGGWTAGQEFQAWEDWRRGLEQEGGTEAMTRRDSGGDEVVIVPLQGGGGDPSQALAFVVARVPQEALQVFTAVSGRWGLILGGILVLGLLLIVGLMTRSVNRPIGAILGAVERHHPDEPLRIPVSGNSEFAGLARSIEGLAAAAAERKQALEREVADRRREQEMMERIVAALPDALMVVDEAGKVCFATERVYQLTGKKMNQVLGAPPPFVYKVGEVIESTRVPPGTRKPRSLEKRAVEMHWLGRPATLVLVRDVTEQRELVQQLNQAQKMEAVGQLAGGISHDFANLLSIMTMSAEMLRLEKCVSGAGEDLLRDLCGAVRRAGGLTKRLLAFSQKSDNNPEPLNPSDVVSDLMKMLQRLLPVDIQVTQSLATEPHPVFIDRVQLEQVIVNLVVNARDAMPEGGELVISTQNMTFEQSYDDGAMRIPAGDYAVIAVTDNGCGMSEEVRTRIFEPFFTTKGAASGTGLGLANVYGILRNAGGVISVYSEIDVGTTFRCYLPKHSVDLASVKEMARAEGLERGTGRILLVEDDENIRALVGRSLVGAGYDVVCAVNGGEAIAILEQRDTPFDLVVTDVMMPKVGGVALRSFVAKHFPHTKILLTSGFGGKLPLAGEEGREEPPFLAKPFSPLVLTRKVKEIMA